jgi:hypothetical protein
MVRELSNWKTINLVLQKGLYNMSNLTNKPKKLYFKKEKMKLLWLIAFIMLRIPLHRLNWKFNNKKAIIFKNSSGKQSYFLSTMVVIL